jgi:hydrogenase maturation protein HypF
MAIIEDRISGVNPDQIARSFHKAVAKALWEGATRLCELNSLELVVLSGGVFQNELLLADIQSCADSQSIRIWTNRAVPTNDGGISLGQAALMAVNVQSGPVSTGRAIEKKLPDSA